MAWFTFGPDGRLFIEAVLLSLLIAALTWRRVPMSRALVITIAAAAAAVALQARVLAPTTVPWQAVRASFVVVPSLLLLGVSRAGWLTRHAWALVLLGPVAFGGCYVGICECAYRVIGGA